MPTIAWPLTLCSRSSAGSSTGSGAGPPPRRRALLLGTTEWLTPNGRRIWRRGLEPDVHVDLASGLFPLSPDETARLAPEKVAETPDQQFRRALEELTQGSPGP